MSLKPWQSVCNVDQLEPDRGVAVLVAGGAKKPLMVALFRLASAGREYAEEWLAVDHVDPIAFAPVMARGLVGSVGSTPVVASPVNKRRYDLRTGLAVDGDLPALRSWPVRIVGSRVEICCSAYALTEDALA